MPRSRGGVGDQQTGCSPEVVARDSQASTQFERESHVLDGLGRKSCSALIVPGGFRNHSYAYDLIGQLTRSQRQVQTGAGGTTNKTYAYDRNFNRTANNLLTATYNVADRITALSGFQTPQYNNAGAINRDQQGATLTYDWRDQLTFYSKPGMNAQYKYDASNLRMEKTVNGTTTQYLWDGDQVLKEYNANGTVKANYFLGLGRGAIKTAGNWYLYLNDTHGSVTGLLDTAGNRVASYTFGDYGETLTEQGSVYNPYRWNGEQLDAESGLVYLRNRYYQPSTGRFMQRDPIGYEGGTNLYAYCGGDPINSSDPMGLESPPRGGYEGGMPDPFNRTPGEYRWDAVDGSVMIGLGAGFVYESWMLVAPSAEYLMARFATRGGVSSGVPQSGGIPSQRYGTSGQPVPAPRLARDSSVNPTAPGLKGLNRPVGNSAAQNAQVQADIQAASAQGAYGFRVNQQQVNTSGVRVGTNRPDLQYSLPTGQRVYIEYDTPSSGRGLGHQSRILSNDPSGIVILRTIP